MNHFDTDVLIIGAGPTGLMMACQLLRFNIKFKIIDKQADRSRESRAFAVQARSMEIFQNLGVVDQFLQRAQVGVNAEFYIHGEKKFELHFDRLSIPGTPFPTIYFIPQNDTEEILINHLNKHHIKIERNNELLEFNQNADGVKATIHNTLTQNSETVFCRYIIGCDGAHSTVRKILKIPFEGASYEQEFLLLDGNVEWPFPKKNYIRVFLGKAGIFGVIPLASGLDRVIGAKVGLR